MSEKVKTKTERKEFSAYFFRMCLHNQENPIFIWLTCWASDASLLITCVSFLSGRKTQDNGEMRPAIDREAVRGSNHYRKGATLSSFVDIIYANVPYSTWIQDKSQSTYLDEWAINHTF